MSAHRRNRIDITIASAVPHASAVSHLAWSVGRGLLTRHVTQSGQILRKLLTRRVRSVPETRDGVLGYRLEGEGPPGR